MNKKRLVTTKVEFDVHMYTDMDLIDVKDFVDVSLCQTKFKLGQSHNGKTLNIKYLSTQKTDTDVKDFAKSNLVFHLQNHGAMKILEVFDKDKHAPKSTYVEGFNAVITYLLNNQKSQFVNKDGIKLFCINGSVRVSNRGVITNTIDTNIFSNTEKWELIDA